MTEIELAGSMVEARADELRFIARYVELTGIPERQARDIYIYFDIIRQRDGNGWHLEQ